MYGGEIAAVLPPQQSIDFTLLLEKDAQITFFGSIIELFNSEKRKIELEMLEKNNFRTLRVHPTRHFL